MTFDNNDNDTDNDNNNTQTESDDTGTDTTPLAERIPGMKAGATARNAGLALAYGLVGLVAVQALAPLLLLGIMLALLIVPVLVWTNRFDAPDKLSALPGISQTGGVASGLVVIGYLVVALVLITSLGGIGADTDTGTESAVGDAEAVEQEHDVLVTVLDEEGAAIANADVEFVHADGFWSTDAETKQADTDGEVTFTTEHDNNVTIVANASGYEEAETSLTVTEDDAVTITLAVDLAEQEHDVLVTVLDEDGEAIANADVEFVHADGFWSTDAETKQANADGDATFTTEHGNDVTIIADASGYEEAETSQTVTDDDAVTITLAVEPDEPAESEALEQDEADADDAEIDASTEASTAAEESESAPAEAEADEIEFSDEDYLTLMEFVLEDNGIDVASMTHDDGVTTVEYYSAATVENELHEELGYIGGAYAGAMGEGLESERLEIAILDSNGSVVGTTELSGETAAGFSSGEVHEYDFALEILNNLEHHG